MKKTTLSLLINFLLFVAYYSFNFYRMWGVSGGDLALILLSGIGFIVQIIIVTSTISLIIDKENYFKSYLYGVSGVVLGVLAGFIMLQIGYQVRSAQFDNENPYYNSNYSGPDSTEYVKYNFESDVSDYSNVNREKIRIVSLNDLGLQVLPGEIAQIDSLEDLSLSLNKGMDFSASFIGIKNPLALKKLSLVNCDLSSLPKEILLFSNLERLYIGLNPELNPEETIKILQGLPQLKELWVQGNEWEKLPSSISELKMLNLLYANSNLFSEFPNSINEMDSLKRVFIRDNPISETYTQFIDTSRVRVFANR